MADQPGEEQPGVTPEGVTPAPVETPAPDAGTRPDTPEPSPGTDEGKAEGPKTLAEAIGEALTGDKDSESEEPDKPEPKPTDPPADKPADTEAKEPEPKPGEKPDTEPDPTEDELKALRPKARKDVVRLLSQRNAARRELSETASKWEADKGDAANFREITGFMQTASLEPAEMRLLFDVGAKLKSNDVQQFNDVLDNVLLPMAANLLRLTGRAIPDDLKAKVDSGEVTEEVARQVANDRARAIIAEQQAQRATTAQQTQQRQVAATTYTEGIRSAVGAWEAQVRASDPDYKLKARALSNAAVAMLAERGPPKSPEEALSYAKEAYQSVTEDFRAARPPPAATRPAPGTGQNGNRASLNPAPRTLEEAIRGAMRPAN